MYEDYMQNLLGIRMNSATNYMDTYQNGGMYNCSNCGVSSMGEMPMLQYNSVSDMDLESCYPDIYNIVYPMVRTACMRNNMPISRELIDEMTNDIYSNIETGDVINLNINIDGGSGNDGSNEANVVENRAVERNRQINGGLRDLIKILLLRELIGGNWSRPNPGPRPPMSPRPMQPRSTLQRTGSGQMYL